MPTISPPQAICAGLATGSVPTFLGDRPRRNRIGNLDAANGNDGDRGDCDKIANAERRNIDEDRKQGGIEQDRPRRYRHVSSDFTAYFCSTGSCASA
jgi:hypothetical protein